MKTQNSLTLLTSLTSLTSSSPSSFSIFVFFFFFFLRYFPPHRFVRARHQETNALTTNRDRVQRELRRQVRLSQSLKQQVKQLEETMKGLERRVEAQRRELTLNEQTMELMDQSRKLAEDQAYEAQKKARLAESATLKSPLRQGRASPNRARGRQLSGRDTRGGYTRVSRVAERSANQPRDKDRGFPRLGGRNEQSRSKVGGYDQNGRRIRRGQGNNRDGGLSSKPGGTFQFSESSDPSGLQGWGDGGGGSPMRGPRQPSGQQRTPGAYRQK
jgi:hypothetical protein